MSSSVRENRSILPRQATLQQGYALQRGPSSIRLKPSRFFQNRVVVRAIYRHFLTLRRYDDIAVHRGKARRFTACIIDRKARHVDFIRVRRYAFK